VPEDRLDEVKRLAKAAVEKIKMGDPKDKDVTLGPLASTKQYRRVQEYIKSGVEEGAELVIGGKVIPKDLRVGISSSPPCSPTSPATCVSRRKKSSDRSCRY